MRTRAWGKEKISVAYIFKWFLWSCFKIDLNWKLRTNSFKDKEIVSNWSAPFPQVLRCVNGFFSCIPNSLFSQDHSGSGVVQYQGAPGMLWHHQGSCCGQGGGGAPAEWMLLFSVLTALCQGWVMCFQGYGAELFEDLLVTALEVPFVFAFLPMK